ncbi:MAG: sigma-54-dependent Fis family transcriptional regulator [Candidatus Omnitrophica bacterium]|nr:sigma-54-dependent Fis family transcriptional regulator [Candidatus Omnitrophota bacterium]
MKAKILIVDDEKLICWSLEKDLTREGYEVATATKAGAGLRLFEEDVVDVVILDLRLPDGNGKDVLMEMMKRDPLVSVLVITANDDIRSAVECMQAGAFTYLHKPFQFDELKLNIEKAIERRKLRKKIHEWESIERGKYDWSNIVAESVFMKRVLDLVRQICLSEASTVLLEGASGTGKDLLARVIHYGGRRAARPFIAVNCAALPATLLESELFGYEKGAFTDARQSKKGLVEEAQGGTLFLDEIGDMPKELQAKLLHLIDQKKFRKIGGVKELEADVRILAATNKDVKVEVREGRFREDLYYRLNVVPIYLHPLRERKEDIPALAGYFLAHFNREFKKSISGIAPDALEMLLNYKWPGNVRELKNIIERAMILNEETLIRTHHLPAEIDCGCVLKDYKSEGSAPSSGKPSNKLPTCLLSVPLDEIEKQLVIQTLEAASGNQSKAARMLGIGRDALRYKMGKYGLNDTEDPADLSQNTQSQNSEQ